MLIIGGLGYVGRFLALYIHNNDLASEVRIVDKVLPQLAWLPPEFKEACSPDKFMQADASRERECGLSCPINLASANSPTPNQPAPASETRTQNVSQRLDHGFFKLYR